MRKRRGNRLSKFRKAKQKELKRLQKVVEEQPSYFGTRFNQLNEELNHANRSEAHQKVSEEIRDISPKKESRPIKLGKRVKEESIEEAHEDSGEEEKAIRDQRDIDQISYSKIGIPSEERNPFAEPDLEGVFPDTLDIDE